MGLLVNSVLKRVLIVDYILFVQLQRAGCLCHQFIISYVLMLLCIGFLRECRCFIRQTGAQIIRDHKNISVSRYKIFFLFKLGFHNIAKYSKYISCYNNISLHFVIFKITEPF